MEKDKFIVDTISFKNMKYMGISQYKKYPIRRIDIRYFGYDNLPSAMLYFTGPFELNTHMRRAAKKRNLLLNEYGLYKNKPGEELKKIKVKSEKEIFERLGMKYLTPEERQKFSDLPNKKK
jgi:DNA polymerase/3'-5' exonuclease PolX